MKNILKIELKKAFSGPSFKTAMLISCFFCLISILYEYGLYQYQKPYIEYWADKYPVSQVFTLYSSWILIEQNSIGRTLFFFWIPVVASIPFATSFYVEEKKRQLRMVLVRAKRRDYFVAKYFAVFLAGASVIAIPLALDFMVSAALYHAEVPIVIFPYFGVMSGEMWSEIFYSKPLLYVIGYIGIEGIYGGLFAGTTYILSFFIKRRIAVLGIPLFLYLFTDIVRKYVSYWNPSITLNSDFSPYGFLRRQGYGSNGWVILGIAAGLLLIHFIVLYRSEKYEIY